MTTFTVTTNRDVVDANDGFVSLREAVTLAELNQGADTIRFAAGVTNVQLTAGVVVINDQELLIDGDRDNDGVGDVRLDARGQSSHLVVSSGATATIEGLTLANGRSVGVTGPAGDRGADALPRTFASPDGGDGFDGGDGTAGGDAAGSIVNFGDLTLVNTTITNSYAEGGAGGAGGAGGNGDFGIRSGVSGRGGAGGDGGTGGKGGDAAGGILNAAGATLHLENVSFNDVLGLGGQAGVGGAGGAGGAGANGNPDGPGNAGGRGGDGGDAGAPSSGGDASSTVLNHGTVTGIGVIGGSAGIGSPFTPAGTTAGGAGGAGGATYLRNQQGQVVTTQAASGANGAASPEGPSGASDFFVIGDGSSTADIGLGRALFYLNATDLVHVEGDSGSTTYTFHVNRTGLIGEVHSVSYSVSGIGGVTGADFVGGALPGGRLTFTEGQQSIAVTFQVVGDRAFEGDEYFTISLSDPSGRSSLGTSSVEGAILADDVIAKVYSDATRTTLLNELYTVADVAEAASLLRDGAALDIAPGAAVRDVLVNANAVTVSGIGASTGRFTLADGVASLTLAGNAAFAAVGNASANQITGNSGANILDGKAGADTLTGGAGDDTFFVDDAGDQIVEQADGGNDIVAARADYALGAGVYVETLRTTSVTATAAIDLTGNGAVQTLMGNAGANVLNGGGGADTMIGYGGNDVYIVDDAGDGIVEAAGGGTDVVAARVDYALDARVAVETLRTTSASGTVDIDLTGNEFVQTLMGNDGANVLDGRGGADTMIGYEGSDSYFVDSSGDRIVEALSEGVDTVSSRVSYKLNAGASVETLRTTNSGATTAINLSGNEQSQNIIGNAGANVINGGGGDDTMYGLGGADTFVFDTPLGLGNLDSIDDFVHLTDKIRLDATVFSTLTPGALAASAFKDISAGTVDSNDRILYDRNAGTLLYDADGSGSGESVLFGFLNNRALLDAGDFTVVA